MAEIAGLGVVESLVHLREGADKDQHNRKREQDYGEPKRCENLDRTANEHLDILPVDRTSGKRHFAAQGV